MAHRCPCPYGRLPRHKARQVPALALEAPRSRRERTCRGGPDLPTDSRTGPIFRSRAGSTRAWTSCPSIFTGHSSALSREMSNVHRHAAATSVVVDLRLTPAEVILSVGDNGRGMQARPAGSNSSKPSLGVGIRLHQFGSTLRLQTTSRGPLVRARVPSPAHLPRDRHAHDCDRGWAVSWGLQESS
jgi:hypothetical protein